MHLPGIKSFYLSLIYIILLSSFSREYQAFGACPPAVLRALQQLGIWKKRIPTDIASWQSDGFLPPSGGERYVFGNLAAGHSVRFFAAEGEVPRELTFVKFDGLGNPVMRDLRSGKNKAYSMEEFNSVFKPGTLHWKKPKESGEAMALRPTTESRASAATTAGTRKKAVAPVPEAQRSVVLESGQIKTVVDRIDQLNPNSSIYVLNLTYVSDQSAVLLEKEISKHLTARGITVIDVEAGSTGTRFESLWTKLREGFPGERFDPAQRNQSNRFVLEDLSARFTAEKPLAWISTERSSANKNPHNNQFHSNKAAFPLHSYVS